MSDGPRLMTFSADGNVQNHTPFGEHLQSFLAENIDVLPGFGWMDGGCLALAQAMRVWGPAMFEPVAWVSWLDGMQPAEVSRSIDDSRILVQHYAVACELEDLTLVIDGDGVGAVVDFEQKMTALERRPGFIHPDAARLIESSNSRSDLEVNLAQASPYISEIVKRLRREFGDFSPSFLNIDLPSERSPRMAM